MKAPGIFWLLLLALFYSQQGEALPSFTRLATTSKNHNHSVHQVHDDNNKLDVDSRLSVVPRSGSDDEPTLMEKIFSSRTALKILSIGMLPTAIFLLSCPQKFTDAVIATKTAVDGDAAAAAAAPSLDSSAASDFYLMMWGVRELVLPLVFWTLSIHGTKELCRFAVTATLLCLSIPQAYALSTGSFVKESAKNALIGFQYVYLVYLAISTFRAWA